MKLTEHTWQPPDLSDSVALVTGASRGVGLGIACALGETGATVYVTGRSVRGGQTTEDLPGTIDDAADAVTARGGKGVAIRCDHTIDSDCQALFDRISAASGRLDLLVNNAWAGYEKFATDARFDAPFWEQPFWRYDLFAGSLRGQYVTSSLAVPLLMSSNAGMIVNISFTDGEVYLGQTAYDVSKSGSDRMAIGMAHELEKYSVAAIALHPGFVRTERVAAAWDVVGDGPAQLAHSPEYVGRAIASLAADESKMEFSGSCRAVGDLAARYEFQDIDGRRPPAFHLEGRITLATRMGRLDRIARNAAGAT